MLNILTTRLTEPEPDQEPVPLSMLMDHLRLDTGQEPETLLTLYLQSARGYCERYCNRSFAPGLFRGYWDVSRRPGVYGHLTLLDPSDIIVSSVTSVGPMGESRVLDVEDWAWSQTMNRLYIRRGPMGERVYAEYEIINGNCPTPARNAILLVAGDMYEHRLVQLPGGVHDNETANQLLRMYRTGLGI